MNEKDFSFEGIISVATMFDNESDDRIERALLRRELQAIARTVGASKEVIAGKQKPMVETIRRYFKE